MIRPSLCRLGAQVLRSKRGHKPTIAKPKRVPISPPVKKMVPPMQKPIVKSQTNVSTPSAIEQLRSLDWYTKIHEPLTMSEDEAMTALLQMLTPYASYEKIQEMPASFDAFYKQRILAFGGANFELEHEVDENQRLMIYQSMLLQTVCPHPQHHHRDERGRPSEMTRALQRLVNFTKLDNIQHQASLYESEIAHLSEVWKTDPGVDNMTSLDHDMIQTLVLTLPEQYHLPAKMLGEYIASCRAHSKRMSLTLLNAYIGSFVHERAGLTMAQFNTTVMPFIQRNGLEVNDDTLVAMIQGSLMVDDYKLYEKLLSMYHADNGYLLTRPLWHEMMQCATQRRDLQQLLKTILYGIQEYRYALFEKDYEQIIKCLALSDKRTLAQDVLDIAITLRERRATLCDADTSEPAAAATAANALSLKYRTKLLDAVYPVQQPIEYAPAVTPGMFKWLLLTSESAGELQRLAADMADEHVALAWDVDTFKALLVATRVVGAAPRQVLEPLMARAEQHVDALVAVCQDAECLQLLGQYGLASGADVAARVAALVDLS